MNVNELVKACGLEVVHMADNTKEIDGCYVSDLLSLVMTKAAENNVWITVQTNVNVIAVAVLTEVACVIISENMELDPKAIEKAKEQNVNLFRSHLPSYETAIKVHCV